VHLRQTQRLNAGIDSTKCFAI